MNSLHFWMDLPRKAKEEDLVYHLYFLSPMLSSYLRIQEAVYVWLNGV